MRSTRSAHLRLGLAAVLGFALLAPGVGRADDRPGPDRVVEGAKQVGRGVEQTAKGIGQTVTDGAKEVGRRVEPTADTLHDKAKGLGETIWDGMKSVGRTLAGFFSGGR